MDLFDKTLETAASKILSILSKELNLQKPQNL